MDNEAHTSPSTGKGAGSAAAATLPVPPSLASDVTLPPFDLPTAPPSTALLSIVVPIFNERETLLELLARVRAARLPEGVATELVLVDDGSQDGTREILREQVEGRYDDVRVLYHPENRGKGAAIVTAIQAAVGDYVVVQDADLEYDPNEFAPMLEPLLTGKANVVYGSRFKGEIIGMQPANLLANRVLTIATNVLYPGARISDEATCYKMFRTDILRHIPLKARRFDFCPEVTAKVLKRGERIHEVPIHYRARTMVQGKKIRWTDGVEALWTLIKYRFTN